MKNLFLLLAFAAITSLSVAQTAAESPVQFKTTKFSFGKVKQGTPVTTSFAFTNASTKPVVIEVATAECGCTTPDYPKTPIGKDKQGVIKVTYNAANEGHFEKKVTVKFANIADPVILTIDGDVETK